MIAYTEHYGNSHCGTCGEKIDHNHGKFVSCNLEWESMKMTKEEAIEFAKKYLADRRNDYASIPVKLVATLGGDSNVTVPIHEAIQRAWDVAVEYMLLDIIPYYYGDALD